MMRVVPEMIVDIGSLLFPLLKKRSVRLQFCLLLKHLKCPTMYEQNGNCHPPPIAMVEILLPKSIGVGEGKLCVGDNWKKL